MNHYTINLSDNELVLLNCSLNEIIHDSKGAFDVIATLKSRFSCLAKIVAKNGSRDEPIYKTKATYGLVLDIVIKPKESPTLKVLLKQWVVQRTFAQCHRI